MKTIFIISLLAASSGCTRPEWDGECKQYRNLNIESVGGCDRYGWCGVSVSAYTYTYPDQQTMLMGQGVMKWPSRESMILDAYICRAGEQNSTLALYNFEVTYEVPARYKLTNPEEHKVDNPCCDPDHHKKPKLCEEP